MVKAYQLLKLKVRKTTNALVIEFNIAKATNLCIMAERLAIEEMPKHTQRYYREVQLYQYYRYYKYNYIVQLYTAKKRYKWYRIYKHSTQDHSNQKNKTTHKCALCKENYTIWSPTCKHRKVAIAKVIKAKKQLMLELLFSKKRVKVTLEVSKQGSQQLTLLTNIVKDRENTINSIQSLFLAPIFSKLVPVLTQNTL